jgi:hemin uptake protein HemP
MSCSRGSFSSPAAPQTSVLPPQAVAPEAALDSATLLRGQREVRIRHGQNVYCLRHTRNDKLILTK